jgi:hypothetical protein
MGNTVTASGPSSVQLATLPVQAATQPKDLSLYGGPPRMVVLPARIVAANGGNSKV